MEILADGVSCFTFGNCTTAVAGADSYFTDNDNDATAAAGSADPGFGGAISGDGLSGFLIIHTTDDGAGGVDFSVSSFNNDTYIGTAGGFFATGAYDTSGMGGSVDAAGNIELDVTGRMGVAQFFSGSLGIQPWNTGATFTSSSQTNPVATLTGTTLQNDMTAVLVSASLVGPAWGFFDGTPYTEVFSIEMVAVSGEPVARNDSLSATFDTPLVINIATDLLVNDQHATGDALSLTSFTQPTQGASALVNNGDGTLTYTPAAGFFGTDTFTYTIEDTSPGSPDTASVTINVVDPTNLASPVANDLAVATDEDTPLVVDPTSNDTDADGDTLTVSAFDSITAAGGAVIDNGDGTLTYSPDDNYFGADSFNYTVTDGRGRFDSAQVLITVNAVNDPPVCTDVSLNTSVGTALSIDVNADLLSTCTDVEGDPIMLASTTQPADGMLVYDGVNTLTYTPAAGFIGQDSFTFIATDGTDPAASRTVSISVGKVFGNFTMLTPEGNTFGGTNDVVASWDGTFNASESDTNFNMTFGSDSNFRFFGFVWSAHHIRVFGPGSYAFDTTCTTAQIEIGMADCGGTPSQYLHLTVGAGQIGAHALFNWNTTQNIDVVLLWDTDGVFENPVPGGALFQGPTGPTPSLDAVYELVSRDADGDSVPGARMIDGPFIDYRANFNLNFTRSSEGGEAGTVVSTIDDPSLGGGCTLGSTTATAISRGDLFLLAGFVGWLGFMVMRRRSSLSS